MCRCCFKRDSDSELSSEELMVLFSTWVLCSQAENTVDLVYSCYITQPGGHLLESMLIPQRNLTPLGLTLFPSLIFHCSLS